MKTKSFQEYLEKRLDKKEIAQIEKQAQREIEMLISMQQGISKMVDDYMQKNNIGFNELAKLLNSSASHVSKIRRGEANLTMSSLAHIFAALGQDPQEVFKIKK